jgi:hypothetical protein
MKALSRAFLTHLLACWIGYQLGFSVQTSVTKTSTEPFVNREGASKYGVSWMNARHMEQQMQHPQAVQACPKPTPCSSQPESASFDHDNFIPAEYRSFVAGMSRVDRTDFASQYDTGIPLDIKAKANQRLEKHQQALLLHMSPLSVPDFISYRQTNSSTATRALPLLSAEDATRHCHVVQVVHVRSTLPPFQRHCVAIVPQWDDDATVHKFMRVPDDSHFASVRTGHRNGAQNTGVLNESLPARYVSRTHTEGGIYTSVPGPGRRYWNELAQYHATLPTFLKQLGPIADQAARNQTIVVMTCNQGQSELLVNFVCSCTRRGLPISHVLVFATDTETYKLAKSLGLRAWDVTSLPGAFGVRSFPTKAADAYGDLTFAALMMAKVYCVHVVLLLGYNVLFQDVDVIWYQDPVPYFETHWTTMDVIMQDDGARTKRFAPYTGNSGFYFVRNNERSLYTWAALARMGDTVAVMKSHQAVLNTVLEQQASWRGLKVKTLGRFTPEGLLFPCGFQYQKRFGVFERAGDDGKVAPIVMHMSWTYNKSDKLKYMKQMGDWYARDVCILDEDIGNAKAGEVKLEQIIATASAKAAIDHCCEVDPIVTCYYQDKPSKIPCKDSPKKEPNGVPFWE